jgi:hypothetical protein
LFEQSSPRLDGEVRWSGLPARVNSETFRTILAECGVFLVLEREFPDANSLWHQSLTQPDLSLGKVSSVGLTYLSPLKHCWSDLKHRFDSNNLFNSRSDE